MIFELDVIEQGFNSRIHRVETDCSIRSLICRTYTIQSVYVFRTRFEYKTSSIEFGFLEASCGAKRYSM